MLYEVITGESPGESFPLLCIPSLHSYMAQVDIEMEEGAKGGLTLFYNENAFIGFSADKSHAYYSNSKHWQRPVHDFDSSGKVSLRLLNQDGIVSFYYSIDGGKTWKKSDRGADVTSMNHNAYGGFLSLRLGLFAIGKA